MTPAAALSTAINPALSLLPAKLDCAEARVLLLAIGLQESELKYRVQRDDGPARGLWEFERAGVAAVLVNKASHAYALDLCNQFSVRPADVYDELANNDILAAGFARLLLWCDDAPLPAIGAMGTAWSYYVRNWRPGKPRPLDWPANYRAAVAAIQPAQVAA